MGIFQVIEYGVPKGKEKKVRLEKFEVRLGRH